MIVHEIWRRVQVQPLGCVRRSGIFNSFPSRSDHPAEVACLQSFSEDAQSLGRFVSLEMRLWSFVCIWCICQVAVKLLQVFPRSFQDWLNGVNLSRNSFIVQDETASVVHGFTTAGTGVHDLNLILLIRSSAAILVCGSLRCLSALSPILRTVNINNYGIYKFSSEGTWPCDHQWINSMAYAIEMKSLVWTWCNLCGRCGLRGCRIFSQAESNRLGWVPSSWFKDNGATELCVKLLGFKFQGLFDGFHIWSVCCSKENTRTGQGCFMMLHPFVLVFLAAMIQGSTHDSPSSLVEDGVREQKSSG